MQRFLLIWFGQLISTVGSGLTGFALGVWLYQETGSITLFAANSLAFTLPSLIVTPFAGVLADRWDRRWIMLLSDSGAGVGTLGLLVLLSSNSLQIWHIYLLTAVTSAFGAFQWPAYSAATTMIVSQAELGRASGLVQLGDAISRLFAPAMAGALFIAIGLRGIMLVDFATFIVAVLTLLPVRIPRPKPREGSQTSERSVWRDIMYGWTYLRARAGLLSLLVYFAVANFVLAMVGPLALPMLLNLTTANIVGYSSSIMGLGMLIGTVVMSAWGGPKRRINGILVFGAAIGGFLILAGLRPSVVLVTVAAFGMMICVPIASGCSQALWQSKVAADIQGRVFAIRRLLASSISPVAIALAGPLADKAFEPLLLDDGALAKSLGPVVGVGPGRGTALIFILMGISMIFVTLLAYLYPRLRFVEDELPNINLEPAVS
jgi:MFS family permease